MVKRNMAFILMLLMLLLGVSGCGSNAAETDAAGAEQEEQIINSSEEGALDESVYDAEIEGMESETDTGDMGEGVPESIDLSLSDGKVYQIGETIPVYKDGAPLYELCIDEVVYTDLRDEYVQDPGNVILVTYTYKNLSGETLYIDDMSFQMMSEDQETVLELYYLADIQIPEPVEDSGVCTAQIAYATEEKFDTVILAYQDIINTDILPVQIAVRDLQ